MLAVNSSDQRQFSQLENAIWVHSSGVEVAEIIAAAILSLLKLILLAHSSIKFELMYKSYNAVLQIIAKIHDLSSFTAAWHSIFIKNHLS